MQRVVHCCRNPVGAAKSERQGETLDRAEVAVRKLSVRHRSGEHRAKLNEVADVFVVGRNIKTRVLTKLLTEPDFIRYGLLRLQTRISDRHKVPGRQLLDELRCACIEPVQLDMLNEMPVLSMKDRLIRDRE